MEKTRKRISPKRWGEVKVRWIERNLKAPPNQRYTIQQLAEDTGISDRTIMRRYCKDKWSNDLVDALNKRYLAQRQDMIRRHEASIKELETMFARQQAEMWDRLQKLGNPVAMGSQRLEEIDPETLTVREALELIGSGIRGEREALGLTDTVEMRRTQVDVQSPLV